jgi:NAD(P)H-hydrate epimerase
MAALDRRAVDEGHTTERTLIETAGREVARVVDERWPRGRVVGVLGSGHNGADGLVALRTLRAWGRDVAALFGGSSPPEPDVSAGWGVPCRDLSDSDPGRLAEIVGDADVLLDGLLGTGVEGPPREPQAKLIEALNDLRRPVVAVDGPSGMDFTTGAVPGACVDAAVTVALGWPKLGHLLGPARARCGELVAVEIGFPPPEAPDHHPAAWARAVTGRWIREILPRRSPDAHKGDAGYLTVVAGRAGMAGASVLSARGAGRGGAGIVRVVGDPANRVTVQTAVPDALFTRWDDPDGVADAVSWADALVVGPGLGRGKDRRELVEAVLASRGERPVLLDADGLNAFAADAASLSDQLASRDLVTPHPGELARLLEVGVDEVLAAPVERARQTAGLLGATVLLKGSPSLVAAPDGPLVVATTSGPGVASGGSGDVLSGLAGAYLAAGVDAAGAAAAALFLSGLASDASDVPEGHLASDVPDRIPGVRRRLEELEPASDGPILFRHVVERRGA